jgi:hypothetical protein
MLITNCYIWDLDLKESKNSTKGIKYNFSSLFHCVTEYSHFIEHCHYFSKQLNHILLRKHLIHSWYKRKRKNRTKKKMKREGKRRGRRKEREEKEGRGKVEEREGRGERRERRGGKRREGEEEKGGERGRGRERLLTFLFSKNAGIMAKKD